MGDVGEYWRDHKEYERRVSGARSLGMTLREYDRWQKKCERDEQKEKRAEKIGRCTIQCECGKWLLDTAAHNQHKSVKGRKGHGIKATKEATKEAEHDWSIW